MCRRTMASITEPLWVFALCSCTGPQDELPPKPSETDSDTDTDSDADADTDSDTDTDCVGAGSAPSQLSVSVRLTGTEAYDFAGRGLWVGDLEGDGVSEVVVGAPSEFLGYTGVNESNGSAYLLRSPLSSGPLDDIATTIYPGKYYADYWAERVYALPGRELVFIATMAGLDGEFVHVHDAGRLGQVDPSEVVGVVTASDENLSQLGLAVNLSTSANFFPDGALVVAGIKGLGEIEQAGSVFLVEGPFERDIDLVTEARAIYSGDMLDRAEVPDMADLDSDGVDDLAVGAFDADNGTGRVGIVTSTVDGEHRIWDVTSATIDGLTPGDKLGQVLEHGDIDGDGHIDLFVGGPSGNGQAWVFRGPLSGARTADEAEYHVLGTGSPIWTGYAGAITDLDGDGASEWAIGQSGSIYADAGPGRVLLFRGPVCPGSYTDTEAAAWLGASTQSDALGFRMKHGDIDGDGRGDLVVSAINDSSGESYAGAVGILYGADLAW